MANIIQTDHEEFSSIIEAHNLCVCFLNTWTSSKPSIAATFTSHDTQSQIDFIITRRHGRDEAARRSRPISLDLALRRQGGKHKPVVANVLCNANWSKQKVKNDRVNYDGKDMERSIKEMDDRAIELRTEISGLLSVHQQLSVCQVNAEMFRLCERINPRRRQASNRPKRAWETQIVQGSLAQMWEHHHHLQKARRQAQRRSLRSCLTAFTKSHKALGKAGKQKRKEIRLAKLARAEEAIKSGQIGALYKATRDMKECRYALRMEDSLRMRRPWEQYRHTAARYFEVEMTLLLLRPSWPCISK